MGVTGNEAADYWANYACNGFMYNAPHLGCGNKTALVMPLGIHEFEDPWKSSSEVVIRELGEPWKVMGSYKHLQYTLINEDADSTALVKATAPGQGEAHNQAPRAGGRGRNRRGRFCTHCGKGGHLELECWRKHRELAPPWLTVRHCRAATLLEAVPLVDAASLGDAVPLLVAAPAVGATSLPQRATREAGPAVSQPRALLTLGLLHPNLLRGSSLRIHGQYTNLGLGKCLPYILTAHPHQPTLLGTVHRTWQETCLMSSHSEQ